MTFMQVTKAKQQTTAACSKTRCSEMQQSNVSGEASALIQTEVLTHSDEKRRCLLASYCTNLISMEIGPAQVLAIKAGLAIPWNKLRLLRQYNIIMQCSKGNLLIFRWLKSSGIHLAREERMCCISSHIVRDNISKERESCPLYISTSLWWR